MALPLTLRAHLLLLLLLTLPSLSSAEDPRATVDRIIRDSAITSSCPPHNHPHHHHKTAVLYDLQLPPALLGVTAESARFRSGSLRRRGATFREFTLAPGIVLHPHMKRLLMVHQNLGNRSSSIYNVPGYQLVSPVLGLLIYDASNICTNNGTTLMYSSEVDVHVKDKPVSIDFSTTLEPSDKSRAMCAVFQLDGRVEIANRTKGSTCITWRQGHFAIVIEEEDSGGGEKGREWKLIVVSGIGGAFGAVLVGLLVVALVSVKKKRRRKEEMERRAYEEEALRVSVVGHVRAPTAPGIRTAPDLESDYNPWL